jgi:hypothetical protein
MPETSTITNTTSGFTNLVYKDLLSKEEWINYNSILENDYRIKNRIQFNKTFISENESLIDLYAISVNSKLENGNEIVIPHKPFKSISDLVSFLKDEKDKGSTNIFYSINKYDIVDYSKLTDEQKEIVKSNGNTGRVLSGYDMPVKDMFTYYGYSVSATEVTPTKKTRKSKKTT